LQPHKAYKAVAGTGSIEDLSKCYLISEDSIIKELKARFKKGKIYVRTSFNTIVLLESPSPSPLLNFYFQRPTSARSWSA